MRYTFGQNLAGNAFWVFEKIHEPIFLIHKLGRIIQVNEAGRKLLWVSHLELSDLERSICPLLIERLKESASSLTRVKGIRAGLQFIARDLLDSEYILVEIKRSKS